MKKDTVVSLKKPVEESDPLTALLRRRKIVGKVKMQ